MRTEVPDGKTEFRIIKNDDGIQVEQKCFFPWDEGKHPESFCWDLQVEDVFQVGEGKYHLDRNMKTYLVPDVGYTPLVFETEEDAQKYIDYHSQDNTDKGSTSLPF